MQSILRKTSDCICNISNFHGHSLLRDSAFFDLSNFFRLVWMYSIYLSHSLYIPPCPSKMQRWSRTMHLQVEEEQQQSPRFSRWEAQNTPRDLVNRDWHICPSPALHLFSYRLVKCQYKMVRLQRKPFFLILKGDIKLWHLSLMRLHSERFSVKSHCNHPENISGCWYLTCKPQKWYNMCAHTHAHTKTQNVYNFL